MSPKDTEGLDMSIGVIDSVSSSKKDAKLQEIVVRGIQEVKNLANIIRDFL